MTGSRLLGIFSVVAVLAIGAGLYVLGSPADARGRRLDKRRVHDLESITWRVRQHWAREPVLPATLGAIGGPTEQPIPNDPVSGQPYEYRPLGSTAYELCASFQFATTNSGGPPDRWFHPAGRRCFQLEIPKADR